MTSRALRMIYREVPAIVGCKAACGKCCGPVPWSPEELAKVADRIPPSAGFVPAPGSPEGGVLLMVDAGNAGRCPMLDDDKRCTVYDARPFMCRIFAASDAPGLSCPFGARAVGRPLPDAKARALVNRYKREAS